MACFAGDRLSFACIQAVLYISSVLVAVYSTVFDDFEQTQTLIPLEQLGKSGMLLSSKPDYQETDHSTELASTHVLIYHTEVESKIL